jgi:hypothetical protein
MFKQVRKLARDSLVSGFMLTLIVVVSAAGLSVPNGTHARPFAIVATSSA